MADRFFGLNRGQREFDVTEGASTGSTDIEIRVDTGKSWKKSEILQKLEELKNHILAKQTTFTVVLAALVAWVVRV